MGDSRTGFPDRRAASDGLPHISIVDDDVSVCDALTSLLRSVRYRCSVFTSAEAFLASDRAADTDCMVLDVRMPGMNGLELQTRLLKGARTIPIIYVTADVDDRVRILAVDRGAVAYLEKPFNGEVLLGAIRGALERSR
jgi:FixJ family two-component response regulator